MADLTVTAANVSTGTSVELLYGTAGGTLTAGQVVYADSTDSGKIKLASTATAAKAAAVGVTLNGAASGQPVTLITAGRFDPGATVTVGEVYCVSDNGGGIAPDADVGSSDYRTVLGVGTAADEILLKISASGVAVP